MNRLTRHKLSKHLKLLASNLRNSLTRRGPEVKRPLNNLGCGLRLHLGAGWVNIEGYVNIDGRPASHIHLQSVNFDLNEFTDGSIEEVYMCHVLEHFSFFDAATLISTIYKKLKINGIIRVAVPDFDKLITIYMQNDRELTSIRNALMGGQDYDFNFHKAIYTKMYLSQLLASHGFKDVQEWQSITDFGIRLDDWSDKKLNTPAGDYDVSLNLKAKK
jgi:predicted SAM-dependent methyltransferase